MHGGGPQVKPGKPLDRVYTEPALALVEKGVENLLAHIEIVKKSGIKPVVCINHFYTDIEEEVALVRKAAKPLAPKWSSPNTGRKGARRAGTGGGGDRSLPEESAARPSGFLYPKDLRVKEKILRIATEITALAGFPLPRKA